jgi:hypothetical protein
MKVRNAGDAFDGYIEFYEGEVLGLLIRFKDSGIQCIEISHNHIVSIDTHGNKITIRNKSRGYVIVGIFNNVDSYLFYEVTPTASEWRIVKEEGFSLAS